MHLNGNNNNNSLYTLGMVKVDPATMLERNYQNKKKERL